MAGDNRINHLSNKLVKSAYEILEVPRDADEDTIQNAYKSKIEDYKSQGKDTSEVEDSYKRISNVDSRREYDYELTNKEHEALKNKLGAFKRQKESQVNTINQWENNINVARMRNDQKRLQSLLEQKKLSEQKYNDIAEKENEFLESLRQKQEEEMSVDEIKGQVELESEVREIKQLQNNIDAAIKRGDTESAKRLEKQKDNLEYLLKKYERSQRIEHGKNLEDPKITTTTKIDQADDEIDQNKFIPPSYIDSTNLQTFEQKKVDSDSTNYKKSVVPNENLEKIKIGNNYQLKDFENRTNQRVEKIGDRTLYLYDIKDENGKVVESKREEVSNVDQLREIAVAYGIKPESIQVDMSENYLLADAEGRSNQRIEKIGDKLQYKYDLEDGKQTKIESVENEGRLKDIVSAYGLKGLTGPERVEQTEPAGQVYTSTIQAPPSAPSTPISAAPLSVGSVSGSGSGSTIANVAKRQATKAAVNKFKTTAAGTAAKKLATNTAGKAAASAIGGALSGGALLALQAGLFAAKHAKDIASYTVATVTFLPGLIMAGIGVVVSLSQALVIGLSLSALFILSFVIVIINSGAYVVPYGSEITWGGNTDITSCGEGTPETFVCFDFDSSWGCAEPARKQRVKNAISHIITRPGANRLVCSQNTTLGYRPTGLLAGGITEQGGKYIGLSPLGTSSNIAATYTLSHELGHVLDHRYSFVWDLYDNTYKPVLADGGYLPSYPLGKTPKENLAEAIGLYLLLPTQHSEIGNFSANYPTHYQFARAVFEQFN